MEGHPPAEVDGAALGAKIPGLDPGRLAGEDAPIWLAPAFALIGTLIAVASASAWFAEPAAKTREAPAGIERPSAAPGSRDRVARPQQRVADAPKAAPPPPAVIIPDQAQQEAAKSRVAEPQAVAPKAADRAAVAPVPVSCFSAFHIPFAHNSAVPNMKGREQTMARVRQWMADHPDAILLVEGHADTTGTEKYNVLLSFSRAKAVATLLGRLGTPERKMTIRAAGASEARDTGAAGANDRRVYLRVEGVANCSAAGAETEKR